jgi:cell wall-associated NlpC family hydrolase
VIALAVGLSASSAQAAPATPAASPPSSSAALAQMRTLYQQFATLSESFQEAEVTLGTRQREAAAATKRAHSAAISAEGHRGRIRHLVRSEARSDPFGTLGAMLSSDSPGQFAARVSLIDAVSSRRAAAVAEAARASAAAASAASRAETAVAAADKLARELRAQRADLKRRADQAAALFHRLSAAERQALTEAQTTAAAARASRSSQRTTPPSTAPPSTAPRSTAPPSTAPPSTAPPSTTPPSTTPPSATPPPSTPPPSTPPPTTAPAVSRRASVAVQTARAQIGDPYVWGATGPDAFDCSGLTSYSWKAAGVILPRTSREQYAAGVKVARSALRPGDLVYFGSPIYHVALYIGNNMMISAPQPGDVVKYQSLDAFSDYAGATRPG